MIERHLATFRTAGELRDFLYGIDDEVEIEAAIYCEGAVTPQARLSLEYIERLKSQFASAKERVVKIEVHDDA